jgi:hypothetical protein
MLHTVEAYPFEPGSLTKMTEAGELFSRYPAYRSCVAWISEFVARHDPRINRPGPVCPHIAGAMNRDLIWLVSIPTDGWSVDEAVEKGRYLADLYHALFTEPGEFRGGSLLAFFPGVPDEHAGAFIDAGHRRLRMEFIRRGLMLGEFHPASQVGSVRNPEFKVMRSPAPMFAVRALTTHDLMFLDTPQTAAGDRLEYLEHYLRYVGGRIGPAVADRAGRRMRAAEEELQRGTQS